MPDTNRTLQGISVKTGKILFDNYYMFIGKLGVRCQTYDGDQYGYRSYYNYGDFLKNQKPDHPYMYVHGPEIEAYFTVSDNGYTNCPQEILVNFGLQGDEHTEGIEILKFEVSNNFPNMGRMYEWYDVNWEDAIPNERHQFVDTDPENSESFWHVGCHIHAKCTKGSMLLTEPLFVIPELSFGVE